MCVSNVDECRNIRISLCFGDVAREKAQARLAIKHPDIMRLCRSYPSPDHAILITLLLLVGQPTDELGYVSPSNASIVLKGSVKVNATLRTGDSYNVRCVLLEYPSDAMFNKSVF